MRILNEFHSLSGLAVNESKTQIMIMGRDPNVPIVKLCEGEYDLKWSPTLKFLGVEIDYRYVSCEKNFEIKIKQIKGVINCWEHHFLSPWGKKMVAQQLCLSKLSNLVISLPNLQNSKIKEIEKLLIRFVWGSRKYKIAWEDARLPCSEGGLGMFCIKSSWLSFKLKWICKAFNNPKLPWVGMLNLSLNHVKDGLRIDQILSWDRSVFNLIISKIDSVFWKEAFVAFLKGFDCFIKNNNLEILMTNFWNTPLFKRSNNQYLKTNIQEICTDYLYPLQFIKFADEGGFIDFYTYEEFVNNHPIFLEHEDLFGRIIDAISNTLDEKNVDMSSFYKDCNIPATTLSNFVNLQRKGCSKWSKTIKKATLSDKNIKAREIKWENRLGMRAGRIDWKHLYCLNANMSFCNHLRFFHICIVKDNLETNTRSVHYRSHTENCTFCNLLPETCLHMLWDCNVVKTFRQEIYLALKEYKWRQKLLPVLKTLTLMIFGTNFLYSKTWIFYPNF